MTQDGPCRCYICSEEMSYTIDMVGLFVDQAAAQTRYEAKGGKYTPRVDGLLGGKDYLGICEECAENEPRHANVAERKYDVFVFCAGKIQAKYGKVVE